jgi:hypothetical protein
LYEETRRKKLTSLFSSMSFKPMRGRPATKWSAWLITACLSALSGSGYATAEHRYGPGEYDLIDHGLAPDGQYAIVAHGDQEGAHLRLFLVDARTQRRIGPLEEADAGFDSAAEAYHALWSPDSRHVALSYRTDYHVNALLIYRIEHHRAFPVSGPGLLATVAPGFPFEDMDMGSHYRELEWLGPTRFRLHDDGYIRQIADRQITEEEARRFGPFSSFDPAGSADGSSWRGLSFSIEAVCQFTGQDQYSILSIKPGTWKP